MGTRVACQSARDYYEHVLLQELKRNQELQVYVGHLELGRKGGKPGNNTACTAAGQQVRVCLCLCVCVRVRVRVCVLTLTLT